VARTAGFEGRGSLQPESERLPLTSDACQLAPPWEASVQGEFQTGPDAQLVEGRAEMILDYLFAGPNYADDIVVCETLPNQGGDLYFFAC
jgi:hypothetical protein